MRRSDKPWATGFFEGEGTIYISKPNIHDYGVLNVRIGNTNRECLDFFEKRWGGSIQSMDVRGNQKSCWVWCIAAKQAARFLKEIRPYIRRRQIKGKIGLALEFQKQKPHTRYGWERYRKKQIVFYKQMRTLNQKGRPKLKEFYQP